MLIQPFTHEEFKETIFHMQPDKAPGSDGSTQLSTRDFGKCTGRMFF